MSKKHRVLFMGMISRITRLTFILWFFLTLKIFWKTSKFFMHTHSASKVIWREYFLAERISLKTIFGVFWSAFSRIRTEYGEIFRTSPYSVQMQENKKNNEYGHFLLRHFLRFTLSKRGQIFSQMLFRMNNN